ncbi:MAG: hypothetical protein AAF495_13095 [Pseudomonadota bacterium]
MPDLYDLSDAVHDETSFIEFIDALRSDWLDERRKEQVNASPPYGRGANGWENGDIDGFLDAASAWARASRCGMLLYEVPANPWARAAQILHAGKFYE